MNQPFETGRLSGQLPAHRWHLPRIAAALIVALALPLDGQAQGKDDLFEVTTKMEMAGMPMALPAQTTQVCTRKNAKDEEIIPRRENCRVTESKRVGNKINYKMACTGKDAMDVVGEMTYAGTSYDGKMVMTGKMDGQPMTMTQTFSGKRVGDCTAK